MGRRDVGRGSSPKNNVVNPPVDEYRKNIGKQDWKKSKKEMKAIKKKADLKKSEMGVKELGLMVFFFVLMLGGVYMFLYTYLAKNKDKETSES